MRQDIWTPEEDEIIRQLYPAHNWPEILAALPNRTRYGIIDRARRIKVRRLPPKQRHPEPPKQKLLVGPIDENEARRNVHRFFAALIKIDNIAKRAGKKVDVGAAISEWAQMRREGIV